MPELLLDAAGRPRSPATLPGFHAGSSPRNKGQRYAADPPTVAAIVAVMRHAGTGLHAARLRALIIVLCEPACASTKPSRSARPTSIRGAARCSCAAGRAVAGARSAWTTGPGNSFSPGSTPAPTSPSVRCYASRPVRPADERGQPAPHAPSCATLPHEPACGGDSRHTTPPCSRRRDGTRGRPADRYPASARTHEPRDHFGLPAGHRQHRDHRHRPRPPAADGPGRRNAPPVGKPGRRCRSSSDATSPDALGVVARSPSSTSSMPGSTDER
jgi:hypothetical protein